MKRILICALLVVGLMNSSAIGYPLEAQTITGKPFVDGVIGALLEAGALDDRFNDNAQMGREICNAGAPSAYLTLCSYVDNIGEGICNAGAPSASLTLCSYVSSIEEGLSRLPRSSRVPANDTQWAWDQISHPSGRIWRCRGIQTGQFAPDYRCSGLPKVDYRWPGG